MGGLERKRLERPGVAIFETGKFCLACDLGQSVDPTAIAIIEHVRRARVTYRGFETPLPEEFHVRHLARLPLGLSYPDQVAAVLALLRRPPLCDGCDLVVDATGVGRAVVDLFERVGLFPTRVTITSGERATSTGARSWHVPKGVLVSTLDARLHANELKFAAELAEASAMADELKDFRRSVSAAGRFSYEARVGRHDDLVLAVSLGVWNFVGRPKQPPFEQARAHFHR